MAFARRFPPQNNLFDASVCCIVATSGSVMEYPHGELPGPAICFRLSLPLSFFFVFPEHWIQNTVIVEVFVKFAFTVDHRFQE